MPDFKDDLFQNLSSSLKSPFTNKITRAKCIFPAKLLVVKILLGSDVLEVTAAGEVRMPYPSQAQHYIPESRQAHLNLT